MAQATKVIETTDSSFRSDVIESDRPVVVDFWAAWCAPCRMVAPEVEGLADELGDRVVFAKLNVDDNPGIAEEYGVSGIPTLIKFQSGTEARRITGARLRDDIKAELELE